MAKIRRLRRLKWSLVATSMSLALLAPTLQADTLLDIYRSALGNDPQYLGSVANMRSGEELSIQARAALLPQVSANWNKTESQNISDAGFLVFGGRPFQSTASTTNSYNKGWSLNLTQQIYHRETWIALSQSEKQVKQSELAFETAKQKLIVRVAEAYFNVLAARDGLQFAQAEKESIGKQREQTKQRFDVGLIAITDLHEAQARYDQSIASEIIAKNGLDNAIEALREITGSYPRPLNNLETNIPLVAPKPDNINDWTKVAERSNIGLKSEQLTVAIAREEIKRRQAGHLPTIDLTGSYNNNSTTGDTNRIDPTTQLPVSSNFANGGTNRSLTLRINVPLFSGGRTSSQVRQAQADFQRASQKMEQTHRLVIRDTRSAFLGVIAGMSSVKALQQSQISNESALEATKAGFDVGTRTMVDVLLATSNLYNAKRNLSRKRYDYVLNVLKLKQAAGILTLTDLRQINSWLTH